MTHPLPARDRSRPTLVFLVLLTVGCVAERAPSHASAPEPRGEASAPVAAPIGATDAGEGDTGSGSGVTDAASDAGSDAGSVEAGAGPAIAEGRRADAGAAPPSVPLVLKGVRKCTAEEAREEICTEGKRVGMCLDGYCVTEAACPRYCAAAAAREHKACLPELDVKECQGVPECLEARKGSIAICNSLRKDLLSGCLQSTCAAIRMIPQP